MQPTRRAPRAAELARARDHHASVRPHRASRPGAQPPPPSARSHARSARRRARPPRRSAVVALSAGSCRARPRARRSAARRARASRARRASRAGAAPGHSAPYLSDLVALELRHHRLEVGGLGRPELEADERARVAVRERGLRVELEHVLDLRRPRHHRGLEDVYPVLCDGARAVGHEQLRGRQRQDGLALRLARGDVDRAHRPVEVLRHLVRHHLGPADLVCGRRDHGQVDVGARGEQAVERARLDVAEEDGGAHGLDGQRALRRLLKQVDQLLLGARGRRREDGQLLGAVAKVERAALGRVEEFADEVKLGLGRAEPAELVRLDLEGGHDHVLHPLDPRVRVGLARRTFAQPHGRITAYF